MKLPIAAALGLVKQIWDKSRDIKWMIGTRTVCERGPPQSTTTSWHTDCLYFSITLTIVGTVHSFFNKKEPKLHLANVDEKFHVHRSMSRCQGSDNSELTINKLLESTLYRRKKRNSLKISFKEQKIRGQGGAAPALGCY
jgi:hypothetical protein